MCMLFTETRSGPDLAAQQSTRSRVAEEERTSSSELRRPRSTHSIADKRRSRSLVQSDVRQPPSVRDDLSQNRSSRCGVQPTGKATHSRRPRTLLYSTHKSDSTLSTRSRYQPTGLPRAKSLHALLPASPPSETDSSTTDTTTDPSLRRSHSLADDRSRGRTSTCSSKSARSPSRQTAHSHEERELRRIADSRGSRHSAGQTRESRDPLFSQLGTRPRARKNPSPDSRVDGIGAIADDTAYNLICECAQAALDDCGSSRDRHGKRRRKKHDWDVRRSRHELEATSDETTADHWTDDRCDARAHTSSTLGDIFQSIYSKRTRLGGKSSSTRQNVTPVERVVHTEVAPEGEFNAAETDLDATGAYDGMADVTDWNSDMTEPEETRLSRESSFGRRRWSPVHPVYPQERTMSDFPGPHRTEANDQMPTHTKTENSTRSGAKTKDTAQAAVSEGHTPYDKVVEEIHAHPIFRRYADNGDRPGYSAGSPVNVGGVTSSVNSTANVPRHAARSPRHNSTGNRVGYAFNSVVKDIKDHPLFKRAAAAAATNECDGATGSDAPQPRHAHAAPRVRARTTVTVAVPTESQSPAAAMSSVMTDLRAHPKFCGQRAIYDIVESRSAPTYHSDRARHNRTHGAASTGRASPTKQEDSFDIAAKIFLNEIDSQTLTMGDQRVGVERETSTGRGSGVSSQRLLTLQSTVLGHVQRGRGRSLSITQVTRSAVTSPRGGASTSYATSHRGQPNATSPRGHPNVTLLRGQPNVTLPRGPSNATLGRGTSNATSHRGTSNVTLRRGTSNATSHRGTSNVTSRRGTSNAGSPRVTEPANVGQMYRTNSRRNVTYIL